LTVRLAEQTPTGSARGREQDLAPPSTFFEPQHCCVAALVDPNDGDRLPVVGHSYGARVALLAATRSAGVRSLVLYEPPMVVDPSDAEL
jgi:dienelactone hydrolase